VAKRYVLEQKLLLTAYRKSRKPLEIEAWFQRSTNRKWHMGYQMVTWPMTSCDPQRCREEVRSAILATAWLLVCYRAFEVEPAPSPRRWTHNKTRRPECIFQQLTTGYDVSVFFYRLQVNAAPPCVNTGPFRTAGDKHRFAAPIKTEAAILNTVATPKFQQVECKLAIWSFSPIQLSFKRFQV